MDRLISRKTFSQIGPKISENDWKNVRLLAISGNKSIIYVTEADKVYGFGDNLFGSLGLDLTSDHIPSPYLNQHLSGKQVVDIFFGFYYGIALTSSGQCWSWGSNEFGQLGNSTERSNRKPKLIDGLANKRVVQIRCGSANSLALTDWGELYGWGRSGFGHTGDDCFADSFVPILVPIEQKVISISCGKNHSIALTDTGMAYIWGNNDFGQLGRPLKSVEERKRIDIFANRPQLLITPKPLVIKHIFCGPDHSFLLTASSDVYGFGRNNFGQVGNGSQDNQYSPVRINNNRIKFKDIAICCASHISTGVSLEGKYYVWGLINKSPVLRPQEVSNYSSVAKSLFEIYAIHAKYRITYKAIVVNREDIKGLDQTRGHPKSIKSNDSNIAELDEMSMDSDIALDVSEVLKPTKKLQTFEATNGLFKSLIHSFNNPSNYDIRFRFEDQYIFGHKTILNIRNSKFWTEFEPHLDIENKEIKVEDFSYKSFLAFIQYLYTNSCDIDAESVADLLTLANVYGEEELRNKCLQSLNTSIDSTNVCQLYSKAVEQNLIEIEKFCSEYVSRNFEQIMLTQEFQDMNDSLAKKMIISSLNVDLKTGTD